MLDHIHACSAACSRVIDVNNLLAGMSEILRRSLGERMEFGTVLAIGLGTLLRMKPSRKNGLLHLAIKAWDDMLVGGRLTIETSDR